MRMEFGNRMKSKYKLQLKEVPEPTLEDIKAIVEFLKNNKTPGEYNINTALL